MHISSPSWVTFSLSRHCAGYYLPLTKMRPYSPFIEFVSVISMWHYNKIEWSRALAQAKDAYRVTRSCPVELDDLIESFGRMNVLKLILTTQTLKSYNLKPGNYILSLQGLHWLVGWQKAVRFRAEWSHVFENSWWFERENGHCIALMKGKGVFTEPLININHIKCFALSDTASFVNPLQSIAKT